MSGPLELFLLPNSAQVVLPPPPPLELITPLPSMVIVMLSILTPPNTLCVAVGKEYGLGGGVAGVASIQIPL